MPHTQPLRPLSRRLPVFVLIVSVAVVVFGGSDLSAQEASEIQSTPVACPAEPQDDTLDLRVKSLCTTFCGPFPSVSCSAFNCIAVPRNCGIGQPGYVQCNGVRTTCTSCEGECTAGQFKFEYTADCCCNYDDPDDPVKYRKLLRYECVDGQWQYHSIDCGSGPLCSTGGECEV
jgi:hypothetical protein